MQQMYLNQDLGNLRNLKFQSLVQEISHGNFVFLLPPCSRHPPLWFKLSQTFTNALFFFSLRSTPSKDSQIRVSCPPHSSQPMRESSGIPSNSHPSSSTARPALVRVLPGVYSLHGWATWLVKARRSQNSPNHFTQSPLGLGFGPGSVSVPTPWSPPSHVQVVSKTFSLRSQSNPWLPSCPRFTIVRTWAANTRNRTLEIQSD